MFRCCCREVNNCFLVVVQKLTDVSLLLSRIVSSVLEANNIPGAVCSLVTGGADIG